MTKRLVLVVAIVLLASDCVGMAQSMSPPGLELAEPAALHGLPAHEPMAVGRRREMANAAYDSLQKRKSEVDVTYLDEAVLLGDGYTKDATVRRPVTVKLPLDTDLDKIDLPDDGKRAAVLTLTARRHAGLLEELKKAETDEEKKEAETALRENYQKHYAIETWWRQQKLKKLEEELAALKSQVQKRVDSEEKYVEAAMTIAQLHIDGVSITPPVPAAPTQGSGSVQQGVYSPYYSADQLPMRDIGALPTYGAPPSNGNGSKFLSDGDSLPPTTRYLEPEPTFPKPSLPLNPAVEQPAKGNSTSSNLAPERTFGWEFDEGGDSQQGG